MPVMDIISNAKDIIWSQLIPIEFSDSRSNIIRSNGNVVYCAIYKGLKDLFRKDVEETRVFGRRVCDRVAATMKNHGFFTTDELPKYGLSRHEKETIFKQTGADSEDDLVVIFAYDAEEAKASKILVEELIREARYTWIYNS